MEFPLIYAGRRKTHRLEQHSIIRAFRRNDGQPTLTAGWQVSLFGETEDVAVKSKSLVLIIHHDAGQRIAMPDGVVPWLSR